jgi:hypothetical protein
MKKNKYKVYVYEAYAKTYEVEAESEIDAIINIEKNGNEVQITGTIRGQVLPKNTKIEEFRIEEAVKI